MLHFANTSQLLMQGSRCPRCLVHTVMVLIPSAERRPRHPLLPVFSLSHPPAHPTKPFFSGAHTLPQGGGACLPFWKFWVPSAETPSPPPGVGVGQEWVGLFGGQYL